MAAWMRKGAIALAVLAVAVATVAAAAYLIGAYPYVGIPLIAVLVIVAWWRLYNRLLRQAEEAYRRTRRDKRR